jgi:integrase
LLYRGAPIGDHRTSLKKARRDAGIVHGRDKKDGFIFHNTRHRFKTCAREGGVPESVIMAITGHSTRSMFDRYNTIDTEDLHDAARQMGSYLQEISKTIKQ